MGGEDQPYCTIAADLSDIIHELKRKGLLIHLMVTDNLANEQCSLNAEWGDSDACLGHVGLASMSSLAGLPGKARSLRCRCPNRTNRIHRNMILEETELVSHRLAYGFRQPCVPGGRLP
jgi:hypothetical protein